MTAPEPLHCLMDIVGGDAEKGKSLAFLAANPEQTVEEIAEKISLPKSTAYKLFKELLAANLVFKTGRKHRKAKFSIVPFQVKTKIRVADKVSNLIMTPENVKVYAAQSQPAIRFFIERHGFKKFLRFAKLYKKQEEGKIPIFLIAKDLGVTEYEIASMISDIEDLIRPNR